MISNAASEAFFRDDAHGARESAFDFYEENVIPFDFHYLSWIF